MKTVNSLSGGQTSSYIAANYPADKDVFALIRTSDKRCMFPDKKLRQVVSDRIGKDFIGTLEDDTIIYTMLDLEQFIGRKIDWVSGITFDELIKKKHSVPNHAKRFCTDYMKVRVIAEWWYNTFQGEPVEMRIGFRANEKSRADKMMSKANEDGFTEEKVRIKINPDPKKYDKWKKFAWRKPVFPLIEDNIFKDNVEDYWKEKSVRFAKMNNCVGCFNQDRLLLRKKWDWDPVKMQWFADQEGVFNEKNIWLSCKKDGVSYSEIAKTRLQIDLFESDFDDCDSGYCGI